MCGFWLHLGNIEPLLAALSEDFGKLELVHMRHDEFALEGRLEPLGIAEFECDLIRTYLLHCNTKRE